MPEYELVIRGGTVVDGTGAEARTADVAIADGRIVEVGRVQGSGRREIDTPGAVVTPGFVDIHAHYDGQATWDSHLTPSSVHGVTTVVMGNCGVGFAPVHDFDRDLLIELMEGIEDIPGTVLYEGLSWDWTSFPDYLDVLDRRARDIDVAAQVPHAALRLHVMGERGIRRDPATPDDIREMARLTAEAVQAGALGFTTSRSINHRSSRGEPTPTLTAEVDELVGIAMALRAIGSGVIEVTSDFESVDDEFDIFRRMVAESGRPLSFSLVQLPAAPEKWRTVLDRLEKTNADGLPVRGQVAPRAVGGLMGLHCSDHPLARNPAWKSIAHLTPAEQAKVMADGDFRRQVLDAAHTEPERRPIPGIGDRYEYLYEIGERPNYEPDPSTSLRARASQLGCRVEELVYDVLMKDEGRAMLYSPVVNYSYGNLDAVREMLVHPNTVPGLGDGGAHVGIICDGSFPTTMMSHWGRDRSHGRVELPFLVQRHTRDTAIAVGLLDRGVLQPGYRADVNVIDFDRLAVLPPRMAYDLPGGGRRLLQDATGYVHTFVRGVEIASNGAMTGELPGRLVRGAQPAPTP